jgi:hypothetical protein
MNRTPDLDSRLDEALDESFPASDPPAVHSIDTEDAAPTPRRTEVPPPPAAKPLTPG